MGNNNSKGPGLFRSKTSRRSSASGETANTSGSPENTEVKETRSARSKKKKRKKHVLLKILAALVCLGLVCCIVVGAYVFKIIKSAPDIETDDIYSLLSQTSTIYDKDGNVIENIFGDKKRTIVSIDEIPLNVQNAFIAIEDKTFRTHHGFNVVRIFGAIFNKVIHGGDIGGTSTITQQLARNLYLEDTMMERSLDRKIKEAYYAYILEQRLSKDQILEAYLNTVNFGRTSRILRWLKELRLHVCQTPLHTTHWFLPFIQTISANLRIRCFIPTVISPIAGMTAARTVWISVSTSCLSRVSSLRRNTTEP